MHGAIEIDGAKPETVPGRLDGSGALALIWLLFLVPRALLIALDVTPTSDAAWYFDRASELAAGLGYLGETGPTAYWPPGWPLTLSVLFRAFGASAVVVGIANCLFAALAGWLLYDLARHVSGSERAGRIALLLYAVYPNAIGYVPLALTEVFYTALLLAICWLLVVRPSLPRLALAGLVLGMATLVKAQSLVVVPVILGIALLRERGMMRRLPAIMGQGLVLAAFAATVVVPWSFRNYREMGAVIAVSTNGGITLLTGNNGTAEGGFTPGDPVVQALEQRSDLGEVERDAEAKRLAVQWIGENPGRFMGLMPLKFARLWGPDGEAQWAYETGYAGYARHAGVFRMARIVNQAYYFALLALFVLAAVATLRRIRRERSRLVDWWLLPYGIALYPSLIAVVFSGQSRFHFPAMPFVCLAVGCFVADRLSRRRAAAAPAA